MIERPDRPAATSSSPRPFRRPSGPLAAVRTLVPGVAVLVVLAAVAWAVSLMFPSVSPLVAGVALGALVVNVVPIPHRCAPGIDNGGRRLLRVGIVLLGLRLSIGDLAGLGPRGLVVVAVVVAVTFVGTRWLAQRLGVAPDLGLLVATGYSICGASAIAAMNGVVGADEEETAYAITLVTLCGTLSIFLLPALGGPLGLEGEAFGSWVGASVHDVGQVVATATHGGADALAVATVVKLTRVALLAPMVAGVAIIRRRSAVRRSAAAVGLAADGDGQPRVPILPLFVVGFLAAVTVRSTGALSESALDWITTVEKLVLTVAMVGLGMGVRLGRMRQIGGRPLVLGLAAWILVAGMAYLATTAVN